MNVHYLRIESHWFDRLADGSKTAEVRNHDRDFQIGDRLIFVAPPEDYDPFRFDDRVRGPHREIDATISHILPASVFPKGIQPGYSVLSLRDISEPRRVEPEDGTR